MMFRVFLTIGVLQVITMLLLLVRTKTLAVMLGPELVGVMAVIEKLLAVIAQTASLSLPFAAVRFLPERWEAGPAEFRELFTRMFNVLAALILAATAIALLVTWFRPDTWGKALLAYRDVLAVALLGLPVIGAIPFLQNAIAGRMQQNRSMIVGFLHALVVAISVLGIWWNGLLGYYAIYAVIGAALVVAVMGMATKGIDAPKPPRISLALPGNIWRFSSALLILAFLSPFAALFVHYRLLSEHGAVAAGLMQAAIGISLSVRAVLGTAHGVFLTPNVNRGGSAADRMAWANNFQMIFCLIAGLALPPLLLFPDIAIYLLYSAEFSRGAAFVMLFVLTEIVILLSGTYQSLVIALDHMSFHVWTNLTAHLLVVGIAYLLVGPLDILGAGIAVLVAPVFLFVATTIFLYRKYDIYIPGRVAARSTWLLISILATGSMGVFFRLLDWESIVFKAGIYLMVVGGFAILLTDEERQRIRTKLADWKRRWV